MYTVYYKHKNRNDDFYVKLNSFIYYNNAMSFIYKQQEDDKQQCYDYRLVKEEIINIPEDKPKLTSLYVILSYNKDIEQITINKFVTNEKQAIEDCNNLNNMYKTSIYYYQEIKLGI